MKIKGLKKRYGIDRDNTLYKWYSLLEKLINELNSRELPAHVMDVVNQEIDELNAYSGSDKDLLKELKKAQNRILKNLEKELKLVVKNHYRNTWLAVGMAVFGAPMGVALGAGLGNMAFVGVGIPLGMVIGMAVGSAMDKKAYEEGRQLKLEIEQ